MKIMLLVNLKIDTHTTYAQGTVFEGSMETFPDEIRAEYLANRPGIFHVFVDGKNREVPIKVKKGPIVNSATVTPLKGKTPQDPSQGAVGKVIEGPTTVLQSPNAVTLEHSVSKEQETKGDSGTDTIDTKAEAVQASDDSVESESGAASKPKLTRRPKKAK